MLAFSPIVRMPSELISPLTFPSMRSSFWNLIEPSISTSLERMSLPECSAIYFFGSIVGVARGSSRGARPLFSSVPALNDPSPIEDMGFCGMNFFSTWHYGNTPPDCQRLSGRNSIFPEKNGRETVYKRDFGPRVRGTAELGMESGRAPGRADFRALESRGPRLNWTPSDRRRRRGST